MKGSHRISVSDPLVGHTVEKPSPLPSSEGGVGAPSLEGEPGAHLVRLWEVTAPPRGADAPGL